MIGCGNSVLSEDMAADGYCKFPNYFAKSHSPIAGSIVGIDISPPVIGFMNERKDKLGFSNLSYRVGDCRAMVPSPIIPPSNQKPEFADESFDVVMDKATIDALACGESSEEDIPRFMAEVLRILKKGGMAIFITYGSEVGQHVHRSNSHTVRPAALLEDWSPAMDTWDHTSRE